MTNSDTGTPTLKGVIVMGPVITNKRCPWCNTNPKGATQKETGTWVMLCPECTAQGPPAFTKIEAELNWNRWEKFQRKGYAWPLRTTKLEE